MSLLKSVCVAFLVSLLGVASAQTAPQAEGPLVITATPDATTVHPGDTLKFDVAIKNVSKEEQKIDVPNIVWAAATDVPSITIPGWPARGGIGPVVTFQSVTIAAGESCKRSWSANVLPAAELGEVTLRVGVPLKRGADKTWSEALKLKIVAKEAVPNPLFAAWKDQKGKSASYVRSEQISGGAPAGGVRAPSTRPLILSASEITADKVVVSFDYVMNALPERLEIPAAILPDDPAFPKSAGKEDVKIGDKTYACVKYTYTTNSPVEMGRDGQGLRARVTVWIADGVPGGIVKRTISLTIRASYDITDTLQP